MKSTVLLAATLVLAACTGPVPWARPDRVSLSSDSLLVVFTDGTTCRADILAAPSGRLQDCPHPLDYDVRIERQSYLKDLGNLFSPYGTIALRDASGRSWSWRSPTARDADDPR